MTLLDPAPPSAAAGGAEVLRVEDLEASYGAIAALKGVSLRVNQGELVALVGSNGAGKTTLLRVLSGLVAARRGSVIFQGRPIGKARPDDLVARGLVHVPEGRDVLRRMTVDENLLMGAYRRSNGAEVKQDLEATYRRFPILAERRHQQAGTLSGGEQQMLAVGRALMARPRLVLLDEPSLGLAPMLVTQVFQLVRELRDEGLTILLVEQNARQALRYADRAYLLETGKVVLEGTGRELLEHPRLQQAYLGRQPTPRAG